MNVITVGSNGGEALEETIDLKAILACEERLKNNGTEYTFFNEVKKEI